MYMSITTKAGSHDRIKEMQDIYFSDFHKDVYGYRPRGGEWNSWVEMSVDAFNDALELMIDKLEADAKREEEEAEKALEILREDIRIMMMAEHVNWREALSILMSSDGIEDHEIDYWLWKKNIAFAKSLEIQRLYKGD